MKLFDVYPRFDIALTKGNGVWVTDQSGKKYLDLYGGHGVISLGHAHPIYVQAIQNQVAQLGFYSNSIQMPIQTQLAEKLASLSGYPKHELFLCNSGAEANENALKLASFHTGKAKVLAVKNSFHGRTSAAVRVTDNPALSAQLNRDNFEVDFIEMNDLLALEYHLSKGDYCAFILEGIQGVGGLDIPSTLFLQRARTLCDQNNTLLVLDEIQSGFGRSGKFFAHQYAQVEADLITMAKGMGNGFPVAGVLITPKIEAKAGLLGTTFGGNHLACAATIAVLETLEEEALMENALGMEWVFKAAFSKLSQVTVKGKGLMLGLEFSFPVKELRFKLVSEYQIFTGASSNPNLLRILPPLSISKEELLHFCTILKNELS